MAAGAMTITKTLAITGDDTDNCLLLFSPASNIPMVLTGIWIGLDGQSNTEQGVEFFISKADDVGAGGTDIKADAQMKDQRVTHTLQGSIRHGFSTEPDLGTNKKIWLFRFHPQSGIYMPMKDPGDRLVLPGGTNYGLYYNGTDNHNADITVEFEE